MTNRVQAWLREPLLHFLVFGALLFAGYSLFSGRAEDQARQRIEVGPAEVEWLSTNWEARWRRPPTEAELRGLVDDWVRQEVLYREALKLGMDRDDEVIRRRMVQKIEFLTEDLAAQAQPTVAELRAFFQENLDDYRLPELRSFTHIYYNVDRRGESVYDDAERDLAQLNASPNPVTRAPERGDRFMLQYDYSAQSPDEVRRSFGQRFAEALFELEPGDWQGPIPSGYGLHLVRVIDVEEERAPEFAEVRNLVERDFASELRQRANDAMLAGLLEGYDVTIAEEAIRERSLQIENARGGQ
jgi:hypothetical protein